MKKSFSILVSLALCLALLPAPAFAEGAEEYPLWVGGVKVTDANASDIFGDGTAVYDPQTLTLKLSSFELGGRFYDYDSFRGMMECGLLWVNDSPLNVELSGSCSFIMNEPANDRGSFAIMAFGGMNISGSGDLTAVSGKTVGYESCAIYSSKKLSLTGEFSGLVSAKGGKVIVPGEHSSMHGRAVETDQLAVSGGSPVAIGNDVSTIDATSGADSSGIYTTGIELNKGNITAIGGTVIAGDGADSYGVQTSSSYNKATVYSGTLIARGGAVRGNADPDDEYYLESTGLRMNLDQRGGIVIVEGGSSERISGMGTARGRAESLGMAGLSAHFDFSYAYDGEDGGIFISKAGPVNGGWTVAREGDPYNCRSAVRAKVVLGDNTRAAVAVGRENADGSGELAPFSISSLVFGENSALLSGQIGGTLEYFEGLPASPTGLIICDENMNVTDAFPQASGLAGDTCVVLTDSGSHQSFGGSALDLKDHRLIVADLSERSEGGCALEFTAPVTITGPGSFTACGGASVDGKSEALFFGEGARVSGGKLDMTVCGSRSVGPDGCLIEASVSDGGTVALVNFADTPYPGGAPQLTPGGDARIVSCGERFMLALSQVIPRPILAIGGVEVWEADDPVDILGDGSAVYDPNSYTLTLKDLHLRSSSLGIPGESGEFGIAWLQNDYSMQYIELIGTNVIELAEAAEGQRSYGIYSVPDLGFVGSGSLRVTGGDTYGADSYGIYGEGGVNFYLEREAYVVTGGGTASAKSGGTAMSCGVWADRLYNSGGRVICAGGDVSSPDGDALLCGSYGIFTLDGVKNNDCLSALAGAVEGAGSLASIGINTGRANTTVDCNSGILVANGGKADCGGRTGAFAGSSGIAASLTMSGGFALCQGGDVYGPAADSYIYTIGASDVDAEMYESGSALILRAGTVNGTYDTPLNVGTIQSRAAAYRLQLGSNAYAAFASAWTSRDSSEGELAEAFLTNAHESMEDIAVSVNGIDSLNGRPVLPVGLLIVSSDVSPAMRSSSPDDLSRSTWYAGFAGNDPILTMSSEKIALNGHTLLIADFSEQSRGSGGAAYADRDVEIVGPGTLIAAGGSSLQGDCVGLTAAGNIKLSEATLICSGTTGRVLDDAASSVKVGDNSLALFFGSRNWGDTADDPQTEGAELWPYIIALVNSDVEEVLLGDVNLDGEVNAKDLTALARHVAKIQLLTDDQSIANADVNKDDAVNAQDLTRLARFVAKIIPSLE